MTSAAAFMNRSGLMCADNPTPVLPPVLPGPITERNGESWLRDEIHEGGLPRRCGWGLRACRCW